MSEATSLTVKMRQLVCREECCYVGGASLTNLTQLTTTNRGYQSNGWTNVDSTGTQVPLGYVKVGQTTQPELDSLWNLEPVQFTEQWGRVV